ncbi:MAG: two-component regulator propeller domain-containing protein [Cyclobacteriaceae bacterium]|jgi:ligand-binding sensor domain-containing protein/signal transduction histidine kinase|nr:hypothetical protein [Flammeovirgaceae bacterium]
MKYGVRKVGHFIGVLIFLQLNCKAQHFSLRQYSSADGLPLSQVTSIAEDSLGYLWVGTLGAGLARFDGREFKHYNTFDGLASNNISEIIIDNKKQMWICHPYGISKYFGGTFKKIAIEQQVKLGKIKSLFCWRDTMRYTTDEGRLGNVVHDVIQKSEKPNDKTVLLTWHDNNKAMLVLSDSSVMFLQKKSYTVSYKSLFHTILNVFELEGRPIVQSDKGYFEIDFLTNALKPYTVTFKNQFLFYDSMRTSYWTHSKNIILQEHKAQSVTRTDTILSDALVSQIVKDRHGTIWIGTNGNGLYRYARQDFSKQKTQGNAANVVSILQDRNDATWIGLLNGGVRKFYNGKEIHYVTNKAKPDRVLSIKQNTKGEIWAATNNGIALYDSILNTFKLFSLADGLTEDIWGIDFSKETMWAATPNGLVEFKDKKLVQRHLVSKEKMETPVYAIYCHSPNEAVYAATDEGLNRLIKGNVESIKIPMIGNAIIQSITLHRDETLLIGTQGAGVCIFDLKSGQRRMINTKNGLPSDLIYFAATDKEGFTWIGTERGINKLRLNRANEIEENFYYGSDNGLSGIETNQNAYSFGKKKYFGLVDGLYQFNDDSNIPTKSAPLHFTDIQVYYGQYPLPSGNQKPLSFASNRNHLTFFFNKVDGLLSNPIQFQYYLENFDKTWSLPSTQHQSTYGNLPPGNYVFKVKTTDIHGVWNDPPLEYPFTIRAPFYQSIWFVLLFICLLLALTILLLKWQIRLRAAQAVKLEQIRFQEKDLLRKELGRDFHDEMGNQLTRIINYVSILKMKNVADSAGDNNQLYNKVETSAKLLYTGTRDFIWSIDPNNDDLLNVFFYIRDFADDLLREKDIKLTIENKASTSLRLAYGTSREIILIFKEGITNIFKHANPKNVNLILELHDAIATITLRDDGIGFELNTISLSNGLRNMKNRAGKINSSLDITSQPNGGTIVQLTIPAQIKKIP